MGHSTIWRCDRCGAQSEPNAGSELPENWRELDLIGEAPENEPTTDPFIADLCPACVEALHSWLEEVN